MLGDDESALQADATVEDAYAMELPSSEHYGAAGTSGIFRIVVTVGGDAGEKYQFTSVIQPDAAGLTRVLAWRE